MNSFASILSRKTSRTEFERHLFSAVEKLLSDGEVWNIFANTQNLISCEYNSRKHPGFGLGNMPKSVSFPNQTEVIQATPFPISFEDITQN